MSEQKQKEDPIQLLLRTVVRDPDGKTLHDSGRNPAKSFVIQFLQFFSAMLGFDVDGATNYNATDTSGVAGYLYKGNAWASLNFRVDAGVGVDEYGIVVGTGETAPTNTDHKLETQLTEGVGGGNIT
ncbi:unnamed protein product, partial [marine sediment metagenome]